MLSGCSTIPSSSSTGFPYGTGCCRFHFPPQVLGCAARDAGEALDRRHAPITPSMPLVLARAIEPRQYFDARVFHDAKPFSSSKVFLKQTIPEANRRSRVTGLPFNGACECGHPHVKVPD